MKKLLLIGLIACVGYSQEKDCELNLDRKDELTGKVEKETFLKELDFKFSDDVYGKLSVKITRYGSQKYLVFYSDTNLGCISPHKDDLSKVYIKLENDDILTFNHCGLLDCGDTYLKGRLLESEIIRLKKSPIKYIKIIGTQYYEEIWCDKNKDYFIKNLDCIN